MRLEHTFLVYRLIAGALQSLEDAGIEHNNINENSILIEDKLDRYTAYLTGFSEFSMAGKYSNEGFREDLSNLTQAVRSTLSTFRGRPCCDPGLESIMSKAVAKQLSASEVWHGLEEMQLTMRATRSRNYSSGKSCP
jgi:hypothetical protein